MREWIFFSSISFFEKNPLNAVIYFVTTFLPENTSSLSGTLRKRSMPTDESLPNLLMTVQRYVPRSFPFAFLMRREWRPSLQVSVHLRYTKSLIKNIASSWGRSPHSPTWSISFTLTIQCSNLRDRGADKLHVGQAVGSHSMPGLKIRWRRRWLKSCCIESTQRSCK